MKNISIKDLNTIMGDILTGRPIVRGKYVYRLDKHDNGVTWICYKPYIDYRVLEEDNKAFPVGWYALLRIG